MYVCIYNIYICIVSQLYGCMRLWEIDTRQDFLPVYAKVEMTVNEISAADLLLHSLHPFERCYGSTQNPH